MARRMRGSGYQPDGREPAVGRPPKTGSGVMPPREPGCGDDVGKAKGGADAARRRATYLANVGDLAKRYLDLQAQMEWHRRAAEAAEQSAKRHSSSMVELQSQMEAVARELRAVLARKGGGV